MVDFGPITTEQRSLPIEVSHVLPTVDGETIELPGADVTFAAHEGRFYWQQNGDALWYGPFTTSELAFRDWDAR